VILHNARGEGGWKEEGELGLISKFKVTNSHVGESSSAT